MLANCQRCQLSGSRGIGNLLNSSSILAEHFNDIDICMRGESSRVARVCLAAANKMQQHSDWLAIVATPTAEAAAAQSVATPTCLLNARWHCRWHFIWFYIAFHSLSLWFIMLYTTAGAHSLSSFPSLFFLPLLPSFAAVPAAGTNCLSYVCNDLQVKVAPCWLFTSVVD